MKENRWVPVYSSKDAIEATMVKQMLDNNGFLTFEFNQQNAAYGGILGEVKIMVHANDFLLANRVLEKVLDA